MTLKKSTDTKARSKARNTRAKAASKIEVKKPPKAKSRSTPAGVKTAKGSPKKVKSRGEKPQTTSPEEWSLPGKNASIPAREDADDLTLAMSSPSTFVDDKPGNVEYTGEIETSCNYRLMLRAMILTALMLAVFNSNALVSWVRDLPAGDIEDVVIAYAETWHGWMEERGLSDLMTAMREQIQSLKETTWDDLAQKFRDAS